MWPMTSGDRISCRIASAALRRCVSLPAKFSMLKPPTVNSSAAGAGTGTPVMFAPARQRRLGQQLVGAER